MFSYFCETSLLILLLIYSGLCRNIFSYDVGVPSGNAVFSDSYDICESPACKAAAQHLIESMNSSADPCSDFYEFACGGWMNKHPVPPTESHWNHFIEAEQRLQTQLKGILEAASNFEDPIPVRQAKHLYTACIDTENVEADGLKPLLKEMAVHGGWPMAASHWDENSFHWQTALSLLLSRWAVAPLFLFYVYTDRMDSSRNTFIIDQPSLSLARKMLVDPSSYKPQHAALVAWISGCAAEFVRASRQTVHMHQIVEDAHQVILFETELAKILTPSEQRRDAFRIYNSRTVAELQAWTHAARPTRRDSEINWMKIIHHLMNGTGVSVDLAERVVVRELDFIQRLVTLLDNTPRRILANYFWWRLVRSLSRDLTSSMRDLAFQFDRELIGTNEDLPKWRDCVQRTSNLFSFAVGYKYVQLHFDKNAKQSALGMVRDIRTSFATDMSRLGWMDEDTKKAASDKAAAMTEFIGYPDWYSNRTELEEYYAGVSVGHSHFSNMLSLREFLVRRSLEKLRSPVDRKEWLTGPAVVNAYYNPGANSITFPAGILQPPFFGGDRPEALNYGGIGVVIGHEITHGFDDMGRQADSHGNLAQWWSEVTLQTYLRKAQCIVDQYDGYRVPVLDGVLSDSATVNGVNTLGENIADNGGLRLAYKAYRRYVGRTGEEPRLPGLEEITPDQLFFLGFATMWCESSSRESLLHEVLGDPHAPHRFRVLGALSNSKDFSRAYGCSPQSSMNPPQKCQVW